MTLVLALIAVAVGAGVALERRDRAQAHRAAEFVVRLLLWFLMPLVVLFIAPHISLGGGVGVGLGLAFVELAVVGVLAFLVSDRLLNLPRPVTGSVTCAVLLSNTGYLGVPLSSALLGHDAITDAVAFDAVISTTMAFGPAFAVGAAFGTTAGESPRERVRAFLTRNPVLFALIVGLLAPETISPEPLFHAAKLVVSVGVLPLGFFLLGVHVMEERDDTGAGPMLPRFTSAVATVCALRLVAAPLLLTAFVALAGIHVPDAFYLQAAMPSGINTLVVVHVFGLDARTAAGALVWTTAIALVAAVAIAPVI